MTVHYRNTKVAHILLEQVCCKMTTVNYMMELVICKMAKEHYVMKMARCKKVLGICKMKKACCKMEKADCKMEQEDFHTRPLLRKMATVSFPVFCMMVLENCKMASFLVFYTTELVHYMTVDCKRAKNHKNYRLSYHRGFDPMVHMSLKLHFNFQLKA